MNQKCLRRMIQMIELKNFFAAAVCLGEALQAGEISEDDPKFKTIFMNLRTSLVLEIKEELKQYMK